MNSRDPAQERLFDGCSNRGRWGADDELGTLNYVTPEKRREAAACVRHGRAISVGRDLSTTPRPGNANPLLHLVLFDKHDPMANFDYVGIAPHNFDVTHLDAIGHVYSGDRAYNGRSAAAICSKTGLQFGSIHAQRDGIFTRGILLDIPRVRGVEWLKSTDTVTVRDLEGAEALAGVRITTGDAVVVRIGLESRERSMGLEDPSERAGIDAECVEWLHRREVAVFAGDCVERVPHPGGWWPLHEVGLAAMGLVLLENLELDALADACHETDQYEFVLVANPLRIPNGTGSAVNPVCIL